MLYKYSEGICMLRSIEDQVYRFFCQSTIFQAEIHFNYYIYFRKISNYKQNSGCMNHMKQQKHEIAK